jgi:hypothetical protein
LKLSAMWYPLEVAEVAEVAVAVAVAVAEAEAEAEAEEVVLDRP